MALNELRIIVVDGGSTNNSSNTAQGNNTNKKSGSNKKNNDAKDTKLYKMLHYSDEIKDKISNRMTPTQFYALEAGASIATQTVKSIANYYLSDIGRANGDSNYQAQVNRTIEIVSDISSVAGGMWSGAAAGSMFGPLGTAIGLVAGGISSGISLGFKYAERNREYQHEMFKNNTSQAYNLSRANNSANTGRFR